MPLCGPPGKSAQARIGNALGFIHDAARSGCRALRPQAHRNNAELQVPDVPFADLFRKVGEDLEAQPVKLHAPYFVLDFHDEAGAHQLGGARVPRDLFTYRLRPRGARQFFGAIRLAGNIHFPEEPAGTFHFLLDPTL